jgi:hypothetical protein
MQAARSAWQTRPVQFLGEPIQLVQTARFLGVTLDTRLTWSAHVNHMRNTAAERLGMLGPLLKRRICLSVGNGVLLYKQLIRPMMDYAYPIWRSAARSHVRKLLVLQSKCLRIATNAPWYAGNRQIHEDLGIPFFAGQIRALTDSFDSKIADAWNPSVRQLGSHLCRPRANWNHLGNRGDLTSSRPAVAVPQETAKSAQRAVPGLLGCSDWGFPCISSVLRRMPGHNEKMWHGLPPHQRGLQPQWSPPSRRGLQPRRPELFWVQLPGKPSNQNPCMKDKLSDEVIPHYQQWT